MTRERIARAALLLYPERVRAAKGAEMLGTVLDASTGSSYAFGGELAGLVVGGLRARITTPVGSSTCRLIADGVCYSAIAMVAVLFAVRLGGIVADDTALLDARSLTEMSLLGASLAVALAGYDRAGALAALGCIALIVDSPYVLLNAKIIVATVALPVVCLVVMLIAPRRRSHNTFRVAWLIPIAALGIAGGGVGPTTYLVLAPLVAAIPIALILLASDQRPAMACSIFAAEIALAGIGKALQGGPMPIGLPLTVLLLALTPLIIALTAKRTRPLQPSNTA